MFYKGFACNYSAPFLHIVHSNVFQGLPHSCQWIDEASMTSHPSVCQIGREIMVSWLQFTGRSTKTMIAVATLD